MLSYNYTVEAGEGEMGRARWRGLVSPARLIFYFIFSSSVKIIKNANGRENISVGELGSILRNSGMSVVR